MHAGGDEAAGVVAQVVQRVVEGLIRRSRVPVHSAAWVVQRSWSGWLSRAIMPALACAVAKSSTRDGINSGPIFLRAFHLGQFFDW